jgi:hypothetical protein
MREKLAARPWLLRRLCFAFRRLGLMASTPVDQPPGHRLPGRNLERKARDGREPTPREA